MISHWEPEALVTVSNPYSCHLVGLAIRKQQPGIRWLADIGDPFSLEEAPAVNNRALFSERNRRLEQQVFEQANVVSVTTEATARAYAAAIPSTRKAIVIPPLVDSEIGPPPVEVKSDGVKRLVFCGRLYSQLRGPGPLLAAFGRFVEQHPVPRWELHLYGEVEECRHELTAFQGSLGGRLVVHGPVPRHEALAAMQQADVLLNLGNDNRCQLPSKVVEYASLGKPILNVAVRRDDTSAEFLANYPAALCVEGSIAQERSRDFDRLCQFLQNLPPSPEQAVLTRFLAPHRVEAVAERYLELLADRQKPAMAAHHFSHSMAAGEGR